MTTRRVAVVSAGLRNPSSTRLLADLLGAAVERVLGADGERVEVEVVELRDHAHDLTNHLLTGFPSPSLQDALDTVVQADAVVTVTPIFSASYSGLFKTFVDVLEPGALTGTPVLVAATGGTARHSLALEFALRPLFAHLRAVVVPTAVFAAPEDWGSTVVDAEAPSGTESRAAGGSGLHDRVERAAAELADAVVGRAPKDVVDPFDNPTPFEELLHGQA